MKNFSTIINSDLTKEDKHLADMLNEEWRMCKHKEVKAMKSMRKELKALKKQLKDVGSNMEKAITKETESRLRKMGFREENGLQKPLRIETPLGVDGSTPIVKTGTSTDTVEQLAGMSYKQLRDLQAQIEMGNIEGVPRELLG